MYTAQDILSDVHSTGYTQMYTTQDIHRCTQHRIYRDVHEITDKHVHNKGYTQIYSTKEIHRNTQQMIYTEINKIGASNV